MDISKVLEVLNDALRDKDVTIYIQGEEIKKLKAENEELKAESEELREEIIKTVEENYYE